MKVALVYDRVNKFGGAERVLLALHKIWPNAPLYTSVYDKCGAPWAKEFKVVPSPVQKIPFAKKHHQAFPFLMPFAFENMNFKGFDVVISLTSESAKAVVVQPGTLHICYCLTPTRYLWSHYKYYLSNPRYGILNPLARLLMKPVFKILREWDLVASKRPDCYIAISREIKKRIKKYYNRDADVIYPCVDTTKFYLPKVQGSRFKVQGYYLVVSRLEPYKRVDVIIEAFAKLGYNLKIVGNRSDKKRLKQMAGKKIEFLGQNLTDDELLRYYQNCLALCFAGKEDFGLVSLEAQSCGRPVIAFRGGGIKETIVEGKTGLLFEKQTAESLIKAIGKFEKMEFKAEDCRENAKRFGREKFIKRFKKEVEEQWQKHKKQI